MVIDGGALVTPIAVERFALLAAVALGSGLALATRGRARSWRWLLVLLPPAVLAALVRLVEGISAVTATEWSARRLSASIGLVNGYRILPGPGDGPVTDFFYGPVAAIAYTPAAIFSSPTGALWAGAVLSTGFLLLPFAWLLRHVSRGGNPALPVLALAGVILAWTHETRPAIDLGSIHADPPALGLALSAYACLVVGRGWRERSRLACSALLALLAVWAKQPAAPILLALPVYVWACDGWRTAVRYLAWLAALGLVISLAFVLWVGIDGLVYNLLILPSRQPWKEELLHGRLAVLLHSLRQLTWLCRWPILLSIGLAAASQLWRGPVHARLRENVWIGTIWIALCMVPTAALGWVKAGGDYNSYGFATYFLWTGALLGLVEIAIRGGGVVRRAAGTGLATIALVGIVSELLAPGRSVALARTVARIRGRQTDRFETAYRHARRYPGQIYFATNPLITLLAEGKLYTSCYGVWGRGLAGETMTEEQLRAHMPPDFRLVAVATAFPCARWMPLLSGFHYRTALPELWGWFVFADRPQRTADDPSAVP